MSEKFWICRTCGKKFYEKDAIKVKRGYKVETHCPNCSSVFVNGFATWTDNIDPEITTEIEPLTETKSEPKFKVGEIVYSTTWQRDVIILDILPDGFYKVGDVHLGWFRTDESALRKEKITLPTDSQLKKPFKQEISLPEGYQFVDENDNVINTNKIVLEKKKKEYPKTYEECCEVLEYIPHTDDIIGYKWDILQSLQKLLICRDAYWKIVGEEMGLGKSWKLNWEDENQEKHIIGSWLGTIQGLEENFVSHPFAFPTEEMRDAFYENFKELIEICKELL